MAPIWNDPNPVLVTKIEDLQIFADTTTDQALEMIPLSELPESWGQRELFIIPPQNL